MEATRWPDEEVQEALQEGRPGELCIEPGAGDEEEESWLEVSCCWLQEAPMPQ